LCWQTVEQQFNPALAIASSVSHNIEKPDNLMKIGLFICFLIMVTLKAKGQYHDEYICSIDYSNVKDLPELVQKNIDSIITLDFKEYKNILLFHRACKFDMPILELYWLIGKEAPFYEIKYSLNIPEKGIYANNSKGGHYSVDFYFDSNGELLKPINLPTENINPQSIISYRHARRISWMLWHNRIHKINGGLVLNTKENNFEWRFQRITKFARSKSTFKYQVIFIDAINGKVIKNEVITGFAVE
jgi:hypothetical protein